MRRASRSSGWSRVLDWSGARLPHFESIALCFAAGLLAFYGGLRLQARVVQSQESRAFDQARVMLEQERLYQESLPEPLPDELPADRDEAAVPLDPVARAESLFAPEQPLDRDRQNEWSTRRRRAYEASLSREASLPIGRLEIPSIDLSVMILPGTDDWTLNRAVGHIHGTALPGEPGNVGIAGHRDGFFRGLRKVQAGERIYLTTLAGSYEYVVEEIQVVLPTDVHVLEPARSPSLTLVTCYPFYHVGTAPQRYIIRASLAPPSRERAEAVSGNP
ncbi:MAG: class D sortase [Candidatus Polarisedimenticolia bacterium]